jgi:TATA-binding protein-associated factor
VDPSCPPPFPPFSVPTLLNTPPSSLLLASSGKEFARPASFRSPGEVAKARKEAMGRLGLDFLGMGDEGDADMDWDKELADGGDGETSSVADTKVEPMDMDARGTEPNMKPVDMDRPSIVHPMPTVITSFPRHQDLKMEDSPASSPIGRPVSAGSSTSFAPPPPSASSSVFDHSVNRGIPPTPQDPPVELSARERNRLKRKRKAGNSAFVAGAAAPSGSSSTSVNGSGGPAGPPPPPKGVASKYNTVAAGESGSSK